MNYSPTTWRYTCNYRCTVLAILFPGDSIIIMYPRTIRTSTFECRPVSFAAVLHFK